MVLYARGSLDDFEPAVAVVGTRAPSHYGSEVAYSLSRGLSARGISVVSGLARGFDTRAHTGALEGEGKTIAVLGTGIDIVYPPENAALAEKIALKGAVVSELPPGTPPDPGNFPRRNRSFSGSARGLLWSRRRCVQARSSRPVWPASRAERSWRFGAGDKHEGAGSAPAHPRWAVLVRDADDVVAEIAPQIKGMIESSERPGRPGTRSSAHRRRRAEHRRDSRRTAHGRRRGGQESQHAGVEG
jgi:hypothetical protein